MQNSSRLRVCDIVRFAVILLLKTRKINYPKGSHGIYSCQHVRLGGGGGGAMHMIDFQTLLICGGGFSTVECAIDVVRPRYNGRERLKDEDDGSSLGPALVCVCVWRWNLCRQGQSNCELTLTWQSSECSDAPIRRQIIHIFTDGGRFLCLDSCFFYL